MANVQNSHAIGFMIQKRALSYHSKPINV